MHIKICIIDFFFYFCDVKQMFNFNFTIMEKISIENYESFSECVDAIKKEAGNLTHLASRLVGTPCHGLVLFAAAKVSALSNTLKEDCSHLADFVESCDD